MVKRPATNSYDGACELSRDMSLECSEGDAEERGGLLA